jgi:hypothetical protein
MKNFLIYNSLGKILRYGSCQDADVPLQARDGEAVLDYTGTPWAGALTDGLHYIDLSGQKPAIAERKPFPGTASKTIISANGVDASVISGLPNPTQVTVEPGGSYTVTDGTFEFSTEVPGAYTIRCVARNRLPAVFTVEAI